MSINLISPERMVLNPKIVRLNCLAMALLNEEMFDKISLAQDYEYWVHSGRRRSDRVELVKTPEDIIEENKHFALR